MPLDLRNSRLPLRHIALASVSAAAVAFAAQPASAQLLGLNLLGGSSPTTTSTTTSGTTGSTTSGSSTSGTSTSGTSTSGSTSGTSTSGSPSSTSAPTAAAGPLKPLYGNIKPFYGDVDPSYGNLKPFYGNLKPFYGNLKPFWGDLHPFWGDTGAFYGDLTSFWGTSAPQVGSWAPNYLSIGNFWTNAGGSWDQLFATWSPASGTADYSSAASQLQSLVNSSRSFWGSAVQAKTGQSFDVNFANPILAKYGINLANPNSLAALDQTTQALFFLDWYDGLMNFSGTDHVDWWMKSVNWTPTLSAQQGNGQNATIGLLDMTVVGDATLQASIVKSSGVSDFTNGHGAAVASLIVGAHDGVGVMGIAPSAQVVAYNPFDATGTAGWADITKGVQMLKASGASVVNASLGVPGMTLDPGWNNVFTNLSVLLTLKNTVFVMAAGNDGVTQTKNINWTPIVTPAFVVVGSVDVTGKISNFSNTPGSACLTLALGICTDYLRNHFLVAPGELVLVSDGHGGTVRESGTSFAAPLVSGAIALLQSRWPWLVNFPNETVQILLQSAKDLGAPGVDNVYGYGELDITAAQSPLNWNNLIWYTVQNGKAVAQSRPAVVSTYNSGNQTSWNATGAYFYAFEPIGLTQRDFAIPLSQKLIGQNMTTFNGSQQQFQSYLLSRLDGWATGTTKFAADSSSFNGFSTIETAVPNRWEADVTLSVGPREKHYGFLDDGPDYQSAVKVQGEQAKLVAGFGDGAPALAGFGFTQAADYDSVRGGANPLLGLASGGGYVGWSYDFSHKLQISTGILERSERRDPNFAPMLQRPGAATDTYQAGAQVLNMTFRPTDALTLTAGYTHLHEATGLLGMQSTDPQDFQHGSTTDGYSLGLNWALTKKLSLIATGTMGHTRQSEPGQQLAVEGNGLTTSSYEAGVQGHDLFRKGDRLQVTVSQPMVIEHGQLKLTDVEVVDRNTGDIGVVSHDLDISGQRRIAGEPLYAWPVQSGRGYLALFGRAETLTDADKAQEYTLGARYRLQF